MKSNIIILLEASFLLSACSPSSQSYVSNISSEIPESSSSQHTFSSVTDDITIKVPSEPLTDFQNIPAAITVFSGIVPMGKGDIILQVGTAVRICDPTVSDQFVYYCSEPGCTHTDSTCHCYIGNAQQFLSSSDGMWYYIRENSNCKFEIIRHNPEINEREVIASYEHSEDAKVNEYISSFFLSHNSLFVNVSRNVVSDNSMEYKYSEYIDVINLDTLERHKLLQGDGNYFFAGSNGEKAAIQYTENIESVSGQSIPFYELRIYDINTGEYTLISDTDSGYHPFGDSYQLISGDYITYLSNNQIHILNLSSMEDTVIYTSNKSISRSWFFGNQIRFIEKDTKAETVTEIMIDLDGSNRIDYPQMIDSDNDVMKFGYTYLTEHGQLGSYVSSTSNSLVYGWLSADDYLNCRLDQTVSYAK